jgi:ferredoxin--NADP+ reductase
MVPRCVCGGREHRGLTNKARSGAQDFLEASPYYDQSNIPLNTYKNKEPHTGKTVSVKRIVGESALG